jgi:hypothetical protein
MPEMLLSALVQAPFVLVMAYLVQRFLAHLDARDAEWRAFIEDMDQGMSDRLDELTRAIERLSELLISHDAATRGAVRLPDHRPEELRRAAGDSERWQAPSRKR